MMPDLCHMIQNINGGVDITDTEGRVALHTEPNIAGGMDAFQHGHLVSHSVPNIFGGLDHYDQNGALFQSSHANISHGLDTFGHAGAMESRFQACPSGGELYDAAGQRIASLEPDATGFHARFFK